MSNSTTIIVPVYLLADADTARLWLHAGVPLAQPSNADDTILAWLAPWPPQPDRVWLVAAVDHARVRVADGDLARAAQATLDTSLAAQLRTAYHTSVIPLEQYRAGQFRHPQALVEGRLEADVLSPVEPTRDDWQAGREEYTRQLRQGLRALIGAPADAPLAALVAAAVARGRAHLVATFSDQDRVFYYSIDHGAWYFAHAIDSIQLAS